MQGDADRLDTTRLLLAESEKRILGLLQGKFVRMQRGEIRRVLRKDAEGFAIGGRPLRIHTLEGNFLVQDAIDVQRHADGPFDAGENDRGTDACDFDRVDDWLS